MRLPFTQAFSFDFFVPVLNNDDNGSFLGWSEFPDRLVISDVTFPKKLPNVLSTERTCAAVGKYFLSFSYIFFAVCVSIFAFTFISLTC